MVKVLIFFLTFSVYAVSPKKGECWKYEKEYFLITSKTQFGYNTYFYNDHKKWWLSESDFEGMVKIDCNDVVYKKRW